MSETRRLMRNAVNKPSNTGPATRRSPAVRAAHARWAARRRRQIAAGQWQPFVDAAPVREHIWALREAGMPVRSLAVRLGLRPDAFSYILWGDEHHGPGETVRRETAELVLGFWPTLADFPDAARVDATGTRRRVEALAVAGWTLAAMAGQVGMRPKTFSRAMSMDRVTARLARAVCALYDRWWNQAPEQHGIPGWVADRQRRAAVREGWAPALAWDEESIDDPDAAPILDALMPAADSSSTAVARWLMGESVVLDDAGRREAISHLFQHTTLTAAEIGARLDINADSASRAWERVKARARAEGRPVPYRRLLSDSAPILAA